MRPRLARPARRARRARARSRSRSATACPELLARVLAGRGVEADAVEEFLDPTVRRLMPDPDMLTDMPRGGGAHRRRDRARARQIAIFGDYDVDGATSAAVLATFLRHCGTRAADPHPRPPVRRLRPEHRGGARARREGRAAAVTVDCGTTSIEPLARGEGARPRRGDDRPSSGRRARCRRPTRWSTRTGRTTCPGSAISRPSASCS